MNDMKNIKIDIVNHDVIVTIDDKYLGRAVNPIYYNGANSSTYIKALSHSIEEAVINAEAKMWPKYGDEYYFPMPCSKPMYERTEWCNDNTDRMLEERGLVFKTKEEAVEAGKKMLEVIK